MAVLEIKNIRGVNMEYVKIELTKELVKSIKVIVEKTKLFENETNFITQSIIKELRNIKRSKGLTLTFLL